MNDFHPTYKNQASKLRSIKYSIDDKKQTCADMKFTAIPAFSLLFSAFSAFQVGRMALRLHDNGLKYRLNAGIAILTPFLVGAYAYFYPPQIDSKMKKLNEMEKFIHEIEQSFGKVSPRVMDDEISPELGYKMAILSLAYEKI